MILTVHIPRRLAPSYSLLGRWLRRRTRDARRAEALFIVAVTGLILAGVLASFLAWALLHAPILAAPAGPTAVGFVLAHLIAFALGGALAGWGFRPAITVTAAPNELQIQQGPHTVTLPYDAVTSAETISALRYYRHERRYTATQDFVNHPERDVLLLRTARDNVIALGLTAADRTALLARLEDAPTLVADRD